MENVSLTRGDWEEISAALSSKEGEIQSGVYFIPLSGGTPEQRRAHMAKEKSDCKKWARDLARIRRKIDGGEGDGKHAARVGVSAARS